ncbi:MAG TPA: hypothetical protein VGO58_03720 [Chitinophagaceae bacterium]|jgi:hypothetical protein|nr:hypothetical protein [Chitinophagaceae bacterium]
MKRIPLLLSAAFFTTLSFAQPGNDGTLTPQAAITPGKTQQKQTEAMSNRNKNEDKLDVLEITGIGGSVFTTMNYPDISSKGMANATLKVSLSVLTGPTKATGYQFVFTPENEKIPSAVETQNGVTSVFFPVNLYETINHKLETALAQKKKVQLKITQNPNGYREAILVL